MIHWIQTFEKYHSSSVSSVFLLAPITLYQYFYVLPVKLSQSDMRLEGEFNFKSPSDIFRSYPIKVPSVIKSHHMD